MMYLTNPVKMFSDSQSRSEIPSNLLVYVLSLVIGALKPFLDKDLFPFAKCLRIR